MGSDQISDTIRNAVLLESLKSSEVEKFAPFLKRIDQSLREQLGKAELTDFKRARLEGMLKQVDEALDGILTEYTDQMQLDLPVIASWQAGAEAALIAAALPNYTSTIPALSTLKTAAFKSPLGVKGADGGKLLTPFIEDWSKSERTRVIGAIRQGWFEGRTNAEIVRTLRGTKDLKYADGLLAITARNADAVTRTAIQHVAGQARNQFAKQNSDILKGVKIIATLDGRTTAYCRAADGTEYALDEGPRPPFHVRCRTSFILILKDAPSLGTLADRSSMNGQVKADTSYYEWIKTQPAAFQDTVIGKSRAKLFRDGGMTPEQFSELQIGNNFKPRTLDQLRQMVPEAFARAGL
ncbi:phage minor head protein [Pseudomonas fitomaticsae]|uniref:Phage head morphogenesis protein n=1 Tax=Pseudomonas fitomaticsae TaxID=2837969 RepID=A0ABY3Q875_9PSED|nr:phage minor head protein [Pseudomonas fitomaticsae]UFQ02249.1 phage head morphogenesis protein [Pseudomonas fitomaticsae]